MSRSPPSSHCPRRTWCRDQHVVKPGLSSIAAVRRCWRQNLRGARRRSSWRTRGGSRACAKIARARAAIHAPTSMDVHRVSARRSSTADGAGKSCGELIDRSRRAVHRVAAVKAVDRSQRGRLNTAAQAERRRSEGRLSDQRRDVLQSRDARSRACLRRPPGDG